MNAKEVALFSIFTAIVILLDRIRIPLGPISLYFWEIPLVVALLLFGFKLSFSIAVISAFAQALIFPRMMGFLFPVWNLIAMSTTLVAVFLMQLLITRKSFNVARLKKSRFNVVFLFVLSTLVIRLSVTPFVNYFMYKYMLPIVLGNVYSDVYLAALLPLLMIYDTILVLYTVPTGYMIAKKINKTLKMGNTLL
jgi:hypothetical protein